MRYSKWFPKDCDDDDDDDDGGGGGDGGGDGGGSDSGGDEDYDGGDIQQKWWEFAYTDICDKYAQIENIRLAMIQSMDDPGCYKPYVWDNFIYTKTIQNNEQGTNLPHQISNLEQIFP